MVCPGEPARLVFTAPGAAPRRPVGGHAVTTSGSVSARQAFCRGMTSALSRWHASATSKGRRVAGQAPCRFRLASVIGPAWLVSGAGSSSVTAPSCLLPATGESAGMRPPATAALPRRAGGLRLSCYQSGIPGLDVVVHRELVRRRTHGHRRACCPLVLDPGLDEVGVNTPPSAGVVSSSSVLSTVSSEPGTCGIAAAPSGGNPYRSLSTGSCGSILFLMPSMRPSLAENARYGLADGSGTGIPGAWLWGSSW